MKQSIYKRRYKLLSDFNAVHRFLTDIYSFDTLNSYLLPQFFEYAHTHPLFNHKLTHRFGLWEDGEKLVGIACFAGMWLDEKNKYAYLEPLATVPEHRRMGLATVALTAGMKKTKALGATYCFGGVPEFYTAIGFDTVCHREIWKKEWEKRGII